MTKTAFGEGVSRESVEPMYSLLEDAELTDQALRDDTPDENVGAISRHIVEHASVTWENYFVAPPGNQPIHPELSCKSKYNEADK